MYKQIGFYIFKSVPFEGQSLVAITNKKLGLLSLLLFILGAYLPKASASCMSVNKVIQYHSKVNIRKKPMVHRSTYIDTIQKGASITVTETCSNGWFKVITSSGQSGFMSSNISHKVTDHSVKSEHPIGSEPTIPFVVNSSSDLKTMGAHNSYAGRKSKTIRTLSPGTGIAKILRRGKYWYKVRLVNGTSGWLPKEKIVSSTAFNSSRPICKFFQPSDDVNHSKDKKYYICGKNEMDYLTVHENLQMGREGHCKDTTKNNFRVCAVSDSARKNGYQGLVQGKTRLPKIPEANKHSYCIENKTDFWICGHSEDEVQQLTESFTELGPFNKDQGSELPKKIRDHCIKYDNHVVCAKDPLKRHYAKEAIEKNTYLTVRTSNTANPESESENKVQESKKSIDSPTQEICTSLVKEENIYRFCGSEKHSLLQRMTNGSNSDNPKCYRYRRNLFLYCGDSSASRETQFDMDPYGGQACGLYGENAISCPKGHQAKDVLQALIDQGEITTSEAKVAYSVVTGNPIGGVNCGKVQSSEQNCMICNCAQEVGTLGTPERFDAMNSVLKRFFHYYKKNPNNLCDVVYDNAQYSWTMNGFEKARKVVKGRTYTKCLQTYKQVLERDNIIHVLNNPNKVADHYHANYVRPKWRLSCKKLKTDKTPTNRGNYHIHYKCPWKRGKAILSNSNHSLSLDYAKSQRNSPTPSFFARFREGLKDIASPVSAVIFSEEKNSGQPSRGTN